LANLQKKVTGYPYLPKFTTAMKEIEKETIDGRTVSIIKNDSVTDTIVFCNAISDDWKSIAENCNALGCPPFHLVLISGLNWDEDLSPWPAGRIISNRDKFTGHAKDYLDWLLAKILPLASHSAAPAPKLKKVLAGYSMAGLFALYAAYQTDTFDGIISASGSVWFPDFSAYALNTPIAFPPKCIYLSLGDAESISRNQCLQQTESITRSLFGHYRDSGIHSTFELNSGNHFMDYDLRLAKGIAWTLNAML